MTHIRVKAECSAKYEEKEMRSTKAKPIIGFFVMFALFLAALASSPVIRADDNRAPDLSGACSDLQVQAGNKVIFHVYARGVQIYRWDGSAWVFVAPVATLFADANYRGQVGIHYRGPTWEHNGGSIVKAGNPLPCPADATAIPWLRLQSVFTSGPGIFSSVTWVQRVNTVGGLKPTAPGSSEGESIEVPYTAEYYFYRAED
jgi:hypothetical protein